MGGLKILADIRKLIFEMSGANPLWGAPRLHGELLKLGIDVGQTTVAKYIAKRRRPRRKGQWITASGCRTPLVRLSVGADNMAVESPRGLPLPTS